MSHRIPSIFFDLHRKILSFSNNGRNIYFVPFLLNAALMKAWREISPGGDVKKMGGKLANGITARKDRDGFGQR
jgi:hypothetical protein